MATSNPGIVIKPPFGGTLANKDLMDLPEGYARTCLNWLKRDGRFVVRPGFTQLGATLGDRALGITQYDHQSLHRFTVVGTLSKWFTWDLTTLDWRDITEVDNELTGSETTNQIFRVFYKNNKAWVIGCNGFSDKPKKWDGVDATYADIAGNIPKCKCMAINNNRLLVANTYTTQANVHQVDVSAFNDFEAGFDGTVQLVNLMDTPGEIIEMRELGNLATAIYKTDSIYVATAQSGIDPFFFELRVPSVQGPISPRAVISLGALHVFLAQNGGLWQFDGNQVTALPDYLRQHIVNTADLGALNRAFGWFDAAHNEIWLIYQGKGSAQPNLGLVINMLDMTSWPIQFNGFYPTAGFGAQLEENVRIGDMVLPLSGYPEPLSDLSHLYLRTLVIGHTGVAGEEGGYNDVGNAILLEMETGMQSPSNLKAYFTADEVDLLFEKAAGSQSITIELGTSEDGANPTYTNLGAVDIGAGGPYQIGARVTSRLFSLRLTASATQSVIWRGAAVSGAQRGLR
jgi:hypothetical protein